VSLRPPRSVPTAHLFTPLHEDLLRVLEPLSVREWELPISPGGWRIREVAAHLLDDDLRRLSFQRDGHPVPGADDPETGYLALVDRINALNGEWVRASARLSPRVLLELLADTGPRLAEFFESLDPDARALFPVAWAGQAESPVWMDVGREFIERWHHQQQIRDAVGAPPLTAPWMLGPLLAVAAHALPPSFAREDLPLGTRVQVEVPGEHGGSWVVERGSGSDDPPLRGWHLLEGTVERPTLRIRMEPALAWRVFLRHPTEKEIRHGVEVEGRVELLAPLLAARALMV
jgi:hypothetical protein